MSVVEGISRLAGHLLRPLRSGDDKLAGARPNANPGQATLRELLVSTKSFPEDGPIPARYAGEGAAPPELRWSGVPREAQELVVLCEDPDAPMPKPCVHWVLYGIAPLSSSLPEGFSPEATPGAVKSGKNSTGRVGFMGPKPPRGHGVHHYHFQVFALDSTLTLGAGADRDALVAAMKGHVIATGEVVGTYETN
jgi:Raf kinase inhibitor-like YbhB/YbcL family protein